jgi:hypothetical protein
VLATGLSPTTSGDHSPRHAALSRARRPARRATRLGAASQHCAVRPAAAPDHYPPRHAALSRATSLLPFALSPPGSAPRPVPAPAWAASRSRPCWHVQMVCDAASVAMRRTQRRLPAGDGGPSRNPGSPSRAATTAAGSRATSPRSPCGRCRSWSSGTAGGSAAHHRAQTPRSPAGRRRPGGGRNCRTLSTRA